MDSIQHQKHINNNQTDSQIGKIYYSICPDDSRYYRTVRIARNPFTGNNQTQLSNPVYGDPKSLGLEPIPHLMRTKLMSVNNMIPYT